MSAKIAASALLASMVLMSARAVAGIVNTPECRRDLATADRLIHDIRLREPQIRPDDLARACRLVRQNLEEMLIARNAMARCMTGHDRGENVAQLDASMEDIRYVLAQKCAGR